MHISAAMEYLVEWVRSFVLVAADEGGVLLHGAETLGALHAQRDPTGGGRELVPAARVGATVMHIMVILKRPVSREKCYSFKIAIRRV